MSAGDARSGGRGRTGRHPTLTPHGVEHVIAALERLRELLPAPPGDGHDREPHPSEIDR